MRRQPAPDNVNVLIGNTNWAWPQAVEKIFRPRGITALVANSSVDMVHIIDNNKIHLTLLDDTFDELSGMQTLKIIRKHDRFLPCIFIAQQVDTRLLTEALNLEVFSVITKPVEMNLLAEQINRLFLKCYSSNIFADAQNTNTQETRNISPDDENKKAKRRFFFRAIYKKR